MVKNSKFKVEFPLYSFYAHLNYRQFIQLYLIHQLVIYNKGIVQQGLLLTKQIKIFIFSRICVFEIISKLALVLLTFYLFRLVLVMGVKAFCNPDINSDLLLFAAKRD